MRKIVNSKAIRNHGYDYFPLMPLDAAIGKDAALGAVQCDVDRVDLSTGVCECWTLFKSGQFVLNRTTSRRSGETSIHAFEVVRIVSHVFEFAKRMARERVLSSRATIRVVLNNVAGFELFVPNKLMIRHAKSAIIEETLSFVPSVLESKSSEMALDAALKIIHLFGWTEASVYDLEPMQSRFLV